MNSHGLWEPWLLFDLVLESMLSPRLIKYPEWAGNMASFAEIIFTGAAWVSCGLYTEKSPGSAGGLA